RKWNRRIAPNCPPRRTGGHGEQTYKFFLRVLCGGELRELAVSRLGDPDPHHRGEQERGSGNRESEAEAACLCDLTDGERCGRARDAAEVVAEARRRRAHRGRVQFRDERAQPAEIPGAE